MPEASVRFYGMLNDLLAPELRGSSVRYQFDVAPSVKAVIEGFGVPHTEVDLVVVNSEPAPLSRVVAPGERIAVYPPFHSITLTREPDPRPLRFVLDVHLGRLARWIRMLGFDAAWRNDSADEDLARISAAEDRILLTRDRGLLMRNEVRRGYWLRATDPRRQLHEVSERYQLLPMAEPFTRCLECNAVLQEIDKAQVFAPEGVLSAHEEFRKCPACRRVFWKGSHYDRMSRLIDQIRGNPDPGRHIE